MSTGGSGVKTSKKPTLKKPSIVSFLNYKGGVGKTNVSVNFAYYAATELGLSTLLIDWDPQGDATEYIGFGRDAVKVTMFDFLVNNLTGVIGENIMPTAYENLHIIGANASLKNVENLVARSEDTFEVFRETVHTFAEQFDIVVIDCPPANSHVNIAAIFASTEIFVVTTPTSDSIDKINLVRQMIENISSVIESNVEPADQETAVAIVRPIMKGIILTMGIENTIGLDVARQHLKSTWGDLVLNPMIPRSISATYSVSECVPILKLKPQEKLSRMYSQLFAEVINRV